MGCFMTVGREPSREGRGRLGIDQKSHQARRSAKWSLYWAAYSKAAVMSPSSSSG
jgi:hypothetical protein